MLMIASRKDDRRQVAALNSRVEVEQIVLMVRSVRYLSNREPPIDGVWRCVILRADA